MSIAIVKTQNQAIKLAEALTRRSVRAEVIATPRRFLTHGGCSYCVRFSDGSAAAVRRTAEDVGVSLEAIYQLA